MCNQSPAPHTPNNLAAAIQILHDTCKTLRSTPPSHFYQALYAFHIGTIILLNLLGIDHAPFKALGLRTDQTLFDPDWEKDAELERACALLQLLNDSVEKFCPGDSGRPKLGDVCNTGKGEDRKSFDPSNAQSGNAQKREVDVGRQHAAVLVTQHENNHQPGETAIENRFHGDAPAERRESNGDGGIDSGDTPGVAAHADVGIAQDGKSQIGNVAGAGDVQTGVDDRSTACVNRDEVCENGELPVEQHPHCRVGNHQTGELSIHKESRGDLPAEQRVSKPDDGTIAEGRGTQTGVGTQQDEETQRNHRGACSDQSPLGNSVDRSARQTSFEVEIEAGRLVPIMLDLENYCLVNPPPLDFGIDAGPLAALGDLDPRFGLYEVGDGAYGLGEEEIALLIDVDGDDDEEPLLSEDEALADRVEPAERVDEELEDIGSFLNCKNFLQDNTETPLLTSESMPVEDDAGRGENHDNESDVDSEETVSCCVAGIIDGEEGNGRPVFTAVAE